MKYISKNKLDPEEKKNEGPQFLKSIPFKSQSIFLPFLGSSAEDQEETLSALMAKLKTTSEQIKTWSKTSMKLRAQMVSWGRILMVDLITQKKKKNGGKVLNPLAVLLAHYKKV